MKRCAKGQYKSFLSDEWCKEDKSQIFFQVSNQCFVSTFEKNFIWHNWAFFQENIILLLYPKPCEFLPRDMSDVFWWMIKATLIHIWFHFPLCNFKHNIYYFWEDSKELNILFFAIFLIELATYPFIQIESLNFLWSPLKKCNPPLKIVPVTTKMVVTHVSHET